MPEPMGVLSYTRKDDEFFGGYITAFRKSLETGVHVVTGDRGFRLFQDVEGIVVGEQWEKKLAEVIGQASFLLPMVSPLFFTSGPCRDEVALFLAHERELAREDLILPVYFLASAKLEKPQERDKDPVAKEIAKRQMYDWRENANVPLQEPAARQAILKLAQGVAQALERLEGDRPATRGGPPPRVGLEGLREDRTAAARLTAAGGDAKLERPSARRVLWVDDRPGNNAWERRALESYGVEVVLAVDTEGAAALLRAGGLAAVISDLGRPGDGEAGLTLLRRAREAGIDTPYFLYTSARAAARLRAPEAQGVTADPDQLVAMVVAAVR